MIDPEAFLRQEVESASPAKLRWLLLQKAHGLTAIVRDQWMEGKAFEARQWVIRIQDIFTELLEGIVDPKHELAKQQSDLYVFLTKLIVLADQNQDVQTLNSVREILEIEKDTWEMLARKTLASDSTSVLDMQVAAGSDAYVPFSMDA
jgi:flagellar secretion chaperone FliS